MPHPQSPLTVPAPQTVPAAPGAVPVPIAVLLPAPDGNRDPQSRAWLRRTVGALVVLYTRPGDVVAGNDPTLHRTVGAYAGWLDRRATLLDAHPFAPDEPSTGDAARLVLAWLPEPGEYGRSLAATTEWFTRVRARLTDDGYLVVFLGALRPPTTTGERGSARYFDHATTVITAARAAGLIYHQHVVALHTLPDGWQNTAPYEAVTLDADRVEARHGRPAPILSTRIHTDLHVFAVRPAPSGQSISAGAPAVGGENADA